MRHLGLRVAAMATWMVACASPAPPGPGPMIYLPTDAGAAAQPPGPLELRGFGATIDRDPPLERLRVRPDVAPISGGTLIVTKAGLIVAGDELTDQIYFADLTRPRLTGILELEPGALPGRMVEDALGLVHVVLRDAGAVVRIDPYRAEVVSRAEVCGAPRGVAYDWVREVVHVVCAGGAFVSMTPEGEEVRRLQLDADLRDVVVDRDRVFVSRFRSAELIILDPEGVEVGRVRPPERVWEDVTPPARATPQVAWRIRGRQDGGVIMAHQTMVSTDLGQLSTGPGPVMYYGEDFRPGPRSIVDAVVTEFDRNGRVLSSVPTGARTADGGRTLLVDVTEWNGGYTGAFAEPDHGSDVAVASVDDSVFVLLHQDDSDLLTIHARGGDLTVLRRIQRLEGVPRGRTVFHEQSRAGIACASCHPEGHEDGHSWITPETGVRRSQSLLGGLRGTEPFHWGGDLAHFDELMDSQSMRLGTSFSEIERVAMLEWLDRLSNPSAAEAPTTAGRAAFETAGCASCHASASFSDELNHDVGAGPMQTPRLGAVWLRAPYFHDGCAATLEQTLDGTCRPLAEHGAEPALRETLVEYLRAL